eukprot:4502366-Pleurochrysis_carterae.AAC.1
MLAPDESEIALWQVVVLKHRSHLGGSVWPFLRPLLIEVPPRGFLVFIFVHVLAPALASRSVPSATIFDARGCMHIFDVGLVPLQLLRLRLRSALQQQVVVKRKSARAVALATHTRD